MFHIPIVKTVSRTLLSILIKQKRARMPSCVDSSIWCILRTGYIRGGVKSPITLLDWMVVSLRFKVTGLAFVSATHSSPVFAATDYVGASQQIALACEDRWTRKQKISKL